MKIDTIITLGRQFGSGGREIGRSLSEKLGIPFYDRDLITMASERSGVTKELLEEADERATNTFLQSFAATSFVSGSRISLPTEISINDKLFFAQAEVIKKVAGEGPCVIVGRCADYILRGNPDCLNVFVHADLDFRARRVAEMFSISPDEAKNTILKTDKKRANYYNYYTNKEWANLESYDIALNSAYLGMEGTVELLLHMLEMPRPKQQA